MTLLIGTKELAEMLGVSEQTIYSWRHQGLGPLGFKVGRHLRFRRTDIEAWIGKQISEEQQRLSYLTEAS